MENRPRTMTPLKMAATPAPDGIPDGAGFEGLPIGAPPADAEPFAAPAERARLNLDEVRAKLAGKTGPTYWRTLEEVAEIEGFQEWMDDEFPNRESLLTMDRRTLLKFMGASLALAGLSGCRGVFLPNDKVVPYVKAPEELVPGKPLYYASVMTLAGYATGVLVQQADGRPIKLEGNPEHPASLGAIDAITQAEILNLYDPDRAQNIIDAGDVSTWELFFGAMREKLLGYERTGGEGLHLLVGAVTSPTYADLLDALRAKFPRVSLHAYEPCGRANVYEGARLAYGQPLEPVYDLTNARAIVSFDADFLAPAAMPGNLRYSREFAEGRRVLGRPDERTGRMNRLYTVESTTTLAGAMADHRFPVKPSEIHANLAALAGALGVVGTEGAATPAFAAALPALVKDLQANAGQSLVLVGDHHAPETHALAALVNAKLGNVGRTLRHIAPVSATAGLPGLLELKGALDAGRVDTLLVLGGNPVYDAPGAYAFGESLAKAKTSVYHGGWTNETAMACGWSLPATHALEAWGDGRAYDGTLSLSQPLVAPLYQGRSEIELLSTLLGGSTGGYDILRKRYAALGEDGWRESVHDGVVKNGGMPTLNAAPTGAAIPAPRALQGGGGLEVSILPDPNVFDGRYSNNGWLQELPRPLTKMTWDNVVILSVKDAADLGVVTDDRVMVKLNGAARKGAAYVLPGHPQGTATIHLGYGRKAGGSIATVGVGNDGDQGGGFDAYALKSGPEAHYGGLVVEKLAGQNHLASTQGHSPLGGNRMPDDRDVIREATLAEYIARGPAALIQGESADPEEIREQNLYPEEIFEWNGDQWGMTVDMNLCTGCNACVQACQAENNVSVVGKEQVGRNREMHWIRIDRYYRGDDENPQVAWQPVMCVHCEKAPCEPVCPVAATVHSHEGLNQMVYNRCVGTRYCSNNCPYKVRHFNYLNYSDNQPMFTEKTQFWDTRKVPGPIHESKTGGREMLKMMTNPRVTVRGRGVMEKCTYCVQRINDARIEAKKSGRAIRDGDIVTACQQACPTGTIVFGNIADKDAAVTKMRKDPRSYLLLEELQTRPRTSHLAKLRNPNPEIPTAGTRRENA